MTPSKHTVGIVVDATFGERVYTLARDMPVWIVDTPANRAAAESHWRDQPDKSITTFKVDTAASPEEWCVGVLRIVVEHHGGYSPDPPLTSLEVVGAQPAVSLLAALAEYGFGRVTSRPEGFRASVA